MVVSSQKCVIMMGLYMKYGMLYKTISSVLGDYMLRFERRIKCWRRS